MRLGGRRPGTLTSFIDAFSEDVLLQVTGMENGDTLVSYHLFDSKGGCVGFSEGLETFTEGREVRDDLDELLLLIPAERGENFHYRLYSSKGILLTCSDGLHTQLFGGIRIEGSKYPVPVKPAPRIRAADARVQTEPKLVEEA